MRHANIPIFIPELACPFRCVFCNQYNISGTSKPPGPQDVIATIDSHLKTLSPELYNIEVAFFGGSFTGLKKEEQDMYLSLVAPYLETGKVKGIRISTRPDYIDREILHNLKLKGVVAIELGAQSMNDDVLTRSGRGHTTADVILASEMILKYDFELGLQMMIGLPGDSPEYAQATAHKIIELGAHTTRIYPCLVIKDTTLERMFLNGKYTPQSLDEAVDLAATLCILFEKAGVKILRMGLHPSESFYEGDTLIAGPFHPAFGEMVLTKVWHKKISDQLNYKHVKANNIVFQVHPSQLNAAIGYKAANRLWLEKKFRNVKFLSRTDFKKNDFHVDTY
jgi:histone acetyltransferase (RNA polymerase elongator complex component)